MAWVTSSQGQGLAPEVTWEDLDSSSRTTEVEVEGVGEVGVAMEVGEEETRQLDSMGELRVHCCVTNLLLGV